MEIIIFSAVCIGIGVGAFFLGWYLNTPFEEEKEDTPYPECQRNCGGTFYCDTWCMAKERFKNNPPID